MAKPFGAGSVITGLLIGRHSVFGLPRFSSAKTVAVVGFVAFGSLGLGSGFAMARAGEGTPLPMDAPRRLVVVGPYRFVRGAPSHALSIVTASPLSPLWAGGG